MRIKINETNAPKIEEALDAVNGKAAAHTITSYTEVAKIAEAFEADLEKRGVAKSRQRGAVFEYVPDGKALPNAYKSSAITTKVVIERGPTGSFLIGVERENKYPGSSGTDVANVNEEQADLIRAKALKGISVSDDPMKAAVAERKRKLETERLIAANREKNARRAKIWDEERRAAEVAAEQA